MDINGSVSEKTFVSIGGAEQGMFIKGEDIRNPVLLFLHGGPGMPEYFLAENMLAGLSVNLSCATGSSAAPGLSYREDMPAEA